MTTPNFTPDVPQWNEPMRYEIPYSNGCAGCPRLFIGTRWIGEVCGAIYLGHDSEKYAARIVSLWNEAIATPVPAATDAGEVQATTPKWPRYAKSEFGTIYMQRIEDDDWISVKKSDHPSSAEAGTSERCDLVRGLLQSKRWIETDAEGNALTQATAMNKGPLSEFLPGGYYADQPQDTIPASGNVPIEQQQASGVEAKVDEVVTLAQDAAFARRDKSLFMVKEGSKFVPADRFIEAEAELASIKREYLEDASTNRQRIDDHEVLIARLRRRLAARDATIAELTKSGEQASSIRDGALAVCKNSHELVLGLINERNGLKKQLTAANERVAALEKERDGLREQVYELKNGDQP